MDPFSKETDDVEALTTSPVNLSLVYLGSPGKKIIDILCYCLKPVDWETIARIQIDEETINDIFRWLRRAGSALFNGCCGDDFTDFPIKVDCSALDPVNQFFFILDCYWLPCTDTVAAQYSMLSVRCDNPQGRKTVLAVMRLTSSELCPNNLGKKVITKDKFSVVSKIFSQRQ